LSHALWRRSHSPGQRTKPDEMKILRSGPSQTGVGHPGARRGGV